MFTITIIILHFRKLEVIKSDEASQTISPTMLALLPPPVSTPFPIESYNPEENSVPLNPDLVQDVSSAVAVSQEVPSKIAHDIAILRALSREIQGLRVKSLAELEPRCPSIFTMDNQSEKNSVSRSVSLRASNRKVSSYKGVFVYTSLF